MINNFSIFFLGYYKSIETVVWVVHGPSAEDMFFFFSWPSRSFLSCWGCSSHHGHHRNYIKPWSWPHLKEAVAVLDLPCRPDAHMGSPVAHVIHAQCPIHPKVGWCKHEWIMPRRWGLYVTQNSICRVNRLRWFGMVVFQHSDSHTDRTWTVFNPRVDWWLGRVRPSNTLGNYLNPNLS